MTMSARVRQLRSEKGFSQKALAQSCGCSQEDIHRLESGKVKIPRYLVELANVLGVSPAWLRYGKEVQHPIRQALTEHQQRHIGLRIKDTREAVGRSVREVCQRLCVSINEWETWEAGMGTPDPQVMMRWYKLDGITTDWIYLGIGASLTYSLLDKLTELDMKRRAAFSHNDDSEF